MDKIDCERRLLRAEGGVDDGAGNGLRGEPGHDTRWI
jgi:hypothetical protein